MGLYKKPQAFKGGYKNWSLCLEGKLHILEYAKNNKLLNKKVNRFLSVGILTNSFSATYHQIDWTVTRLIGLFRCQKSIN